MTQNQTTEFSGMAVLSSLETQNVAGGSPTREHGIITTEHSNVRGN